MYEIYKNRADNLESKRFENQTRNGLIYLIVYIVYLI